MPLRINTNTPALAAQRALRSSNRELAARIERLASSLRVNRAADDAANLAISETVRANIGGLVQGVRNAEQAVNLTQVTEGTLNEVNSILVRMRELAVQASSSTLTDNNRAGLQAEFAQLSAEVDRLTQSTGSAGTTQTFQIGPNATDADRVEISLDALSASGPELNLGNASVATAQSGRTALSGLDQAISRVTAQRADIGALQNRLASSIRSGENALVNIQASESSIRDADIAEEATALARARILNRAATAVLAQANVLPQRVLSLLG